MPRVSVIIPTFNSALTLLRAIESVLNQTYKDLEIIVVDDGSTDETRFVLEPYLDRISYIYQENQERSAARNRGSAKSRGEYIAFLDADDWWLPCKLERQVAMLDANPAVGLVYTAQQLVQPDGSVLATQPSFGVDDPGSDIFSRLVLRNMIGSPSKIVVRADLLSKVGGFDESLNGTEDWDLCLRFAAESLVGYVAEPLTCYQLHKGNALDRIVARNAPNNWISIVDKMFDRPGIRERYGDLEKPAKARVLLRSALVDCALLRVDDGTEKLAQAFKMDSLLFSPPLLELGNWLLEFIGEIQIDSGGEAGSLSYIDRFWGMLPIAEREMLSRLKNRIKSKLFAQRFFTAHVRGESKMVRTSAWRAVWFDPSWLFNIGFLSIWFRSWLGIQWAL